MTCENYNYNNKSLFCCPVCGAELQRETKIYRCPAGHTYDIAKENYTYLLPPNQKHSQAPGDDKNMAVARREFLSKNYYSALLNAISAKICVLSSQIMQSMQVPESLTLLDTGCGEGYYTSHIFHALSNLNSNFKNNIRMAGIDISKFMLRLAAKREKSELALEFAVASSYHLPLKNNSIDILLNCFSPLALSEFRRVLKPHGFFIYIVPAANHLWELKQILYDKPYRNPEQETPYPGFLYREILSVEDFITLENPKGIHALFQMTPYYWKTPKSGADRLTALNQLSTQIAFRIHIFQKSCSKQET